MEPAKSFTIKSLAEEDRPREKLLLKGRQALSSAELIAILIRTGTRNETAIDIAHKIVNKYNSDLNELGKISVAELSKIHGIGKTKAITIIAALELGRRRQLFESEKKAQIRSSSDIYEYVHPLIADLPHEEFWILYLNKSNRVIEREKVSSGGVTGTVVDVKIIMKHAIEKLATSIALCHNHPSGNINPSDADITLTKRIRDAGNLLDITVVDHIIIGDKSYYSFNDEGMI
jgi:DNA repair protein RadC